MLFVGVSGYVGLLVGLVFVDVVDVGWLFIKVLFLDKTGSKIFSSDHFFVGSPSSFIPLIVFTIVTLAHTHHTHMHAHSTHAYTHTHTSHAHTHPHQRICTSSRKLSLEISHTRIHTLSHSLLTCLVLSFCFPLEVLLTLKLTHSLPL